MIIHSIEFTTMCDVLLFFLPVEQLEQLILDLDAFRELWVG